jgi:hypothetical protein
MAKQYKGPKREDGYQLHVDESGIFESRGFITEDGSLEVWTFVKGSEAGELRAALSANTLNDLRGWLRVLDDAEGHGE